MTAYGPAGLEVLVDKLNDLFVIILENITMAGGDVMRFAGDAIEGMCVSFVVIFIIPTKFIGQSYALLVLLLDR